MIMEFVDIESRNKFLKENKFQETSNQVFQYEWTLFTSADKNENFIALGMPKNERNCLTLDVYATIK